MDIAFLPKGIQILFGAAPIILPIIVAGILLKRGLDKVSQYSLFWFFLSSVAAGLYVYVFMSEKFSVLEITGASGFLANALAVYFTVRKEERKHKRRT